MVVFSLTNPASLRVAEQILQEFLQSGELNTKAVIVVGNKTDLVRTREIPVDGDDYQLLTTILVFLLQRPDQLPPPIPASMWR